MWQEQVIEVERIPRNTIPIDSPGGRARQKEDNVTLASYCPTYLVVRKQQHIRIVLPYASHKWCRLLRTRVEKDLEPLLLDVECNNPDFALLFGRCPELDVGVHRKD